MTSVNTTPEALDAEANERHAVEQAKAAATGRHDQANLGAILRDFTPVPDEAVLLVKPLTWKRSAILREDGERQVAVRLTPETSVRAVIGQPGDGPTEDPDALDGWVGLIYCADDDPTTFLAKEGKSKGQRIPFTPKTVLSYRFLGKGEQFMESAVEIVDEIGQSARMQAARSIQGFGSSPAVTPEEEDDTNPLP